MVDMTGKRVGARNRVSELRESLRKNIAETDADIAGVINAVQQANALVSTVQESILSDITLAPDPGYTGDITYTMVGKLVVVDFKVFTTIDRWRGAWSLLRITDVDDVLPVNKRGANFACAGTAVWNTPEDHRWAAGVSEQGHLMLEAVRTARSWPAWTWIAGQVTYHTV